ncbi:storkhead-box protein 2-like isoform X1 [Arapaima gigas]
MEEFLQIAPHSLAIVLSRVDGGRESPGASEKLQRHHTGYEIFADFKAENMQHFWNKKVTDAVAETFFLGWIDEHVLLIQGKEDHLEVLREGWMRRSLKPPRGFEIKCLGRNAEGSGLCLVPSGLTCVLLGVLSAELRSSSVGVDRVVEMIACRTCRSVYRMLASPVGAACLEPLGPGPPPKVTLADGKEMLLLTCWRWAGIALVAVETGNLSIVGVGMKTPPIATALVENRDRRRTLGAQDHSRHDAISALHPNRSFHTQPHCPAQTVPSVWQKLRQRTLVALPAIERDRAPAEADALWDAAVRERRAERECRVRGSAAAAALAAVSGVPVSLRVSAKELLRVPRAMPPV